MAHAKQASKRRGRTKAATMLGVVGLLSAAGGASAAIVGPAENIPTKTAPVITLGEEEIFDVSLSTFYVYDKENGGTRDLGVQLARGGCGHGGCGHGGCAARGCRGCGGCHGCRGCARGGCGGCGGCGPGFCLSIGGIGFCG